MAANSLRGGKGVYGPHCLQRLGSVELALGRAPREMVHTDRSDSAAVVSREYRLVSFLNVTVHLVPDSCA